MSMGALIIGGLFLWLIYVISKKVVGVTNPHEASSAFEAEVRISGSDFADLRRQLKNAGKGEVGTVSVETTYYNAISDTCVIAGLTIPGQFLFTTKNAIAKLASQELPHLILTNLRVKVPDTEPPRMGYWPSYNDITPEQRGWYLRWLAGGKSDPEVDIGYVFLYFYSLEYCALIQKKDQRAILTELLRLWKVYGARNGSFGGYASGFIKFLILSLRNELSHEERASIQKLVLSGERGPCLFSDIASVLDNSESEITLSRILFDCNLRRSVVLERVPELFNKHLEALVAREIPDLRSQVQNASKTFEYHSASSMHFTGSITYESPRLREATRAKIERIYSRTIEDLRPYAQKVSSIGANAAYPLLPSSLRALMPHPLLGAFKELLKDNPEGVLSCGSIAAVVGVPMAERISLKKSRELAENVRCAGYALEPDARMSGKAYVWTDKVVLFSPTASSDPKAPAYHTLTMLFDLGVQIAASDGIATKEELTRITEFVSQCFAKDPVEAERLQKRAALALAGALKVSGLAKKLGARLPMAEADRVAGYVVAVAKLEEPVNAKKFKSVQRVIKDFGLNEERSQSLLREAGLLPRDEHQLAVLRVAATGSREGSTIPKAEGIQSEPRLLDEAFMQRIISETREVAGILGAALHEPDSEEASPEPQPVTKKVSNQRNQLDAQHHAFLEFLSGRSEWPAAEVRAAAKEQGLMASCAIETLNAWAETELGDFLVDEKNDIFFVNLDLLAHAQKEQLSA